MKTAIQFAIIRFMPFAETLEFANVGILAFSPKTGYFGYKLTPPRFKRVSDFFDDLEGKLYANALQTFDHELSYLKSHAKGLKELELVSLMNEVTRTREGLMTFGDIGVMISDSPQLALEQLFDRFIGRDFKDAKEYREHQMVRALKKELSNTLNIRYKEQSLDTGFGSFKLPLVANEANTLKAIKPLAFDQKTALALAEHGDRWISRIKHLLHAKAIKEDNFLFAIENPKRTNDDFNAAFKTIKSSMEDLGVKVIPYAKKDKILSFAEFDVNKSIDDFYLVNN